MKREYIIGILLAVSGVGLVVFFLIRGSTDNSRANAPLTNNTGGSGVTTTNFADDEDDTVDYMTLDLATISRHDSVDDCWLVISGQVYDVTVYLPGHPRGAGLVTPYCGLADATEAFATKGDIGTDHSSMAYDELTDFRLGELNSVISID